jgi:hypothetical protein
MPLANRKGKYKGAQRTAYLIAIGIHVLAGIIFWNTGGDKIIKDIVMEVVSAKSGPPPKPPTPKLNRVVMAKPAAALVKFEVKTSARVDPGFAPVFKEISAVSSDVGPMNFTNMAQSYSVKTFSLDKSQISNVTSDILKVIGVGDLMGDTRGTKVSGVGKRMRARLNLCLLSSPGASILGKPGRKVAEIAVTASDAPDTASLRTRVTWEFVFRKYSSLDRARAWLKENTQIQVTENTVTITGDVNYMDWIYNIRKKGALAIDSASYYYEKTALKRLEHGVEELERNKISGSRTFVSQVRAATFGYLHGKYEIENPEILTPDMLVKKIEERNIMREWRKRGLIELINATNNLKADMSEERLISGLFPIYVFFRKAEVLENPLLIVCNPVGLEKITEENMEILRNYVKNGGFIWIDDTGIATQNVQGQNNVARSFIYTLMNFDSKNELTEKEAETLAKLSADDRNVQGFILGDPFPNQAHPQDFIPITVPQNTAVTVRIFNRLGIPVKQFVWTKEKPMKAGSYIKKEMALTWNCDNNDGEPVESGNYFIQMQAGLYQKTKVTRVSKLRMLDEKHPLMSVVHTFRNIPVCTIESASQYWDTRPYGNAAFGYYLSGRMVILYTEGAGLVAGLGDLNNPVGMEMASKFLNNIIAFCLSDEDGVAIRP